MLTDADLRLKSAQRRALIELLYIKADLDEKDVVSKSLNIYINRTKAEMESEDIIRVEEMFEKAF